MTRIAFTHYGRCGDLVYHTVYCIQRSNGVPYDLHIQTNVPDEHDPGNRRVFMTPVEAEYVASILREQPYIRNLTISDEPCIPADDVSLFIDINLFRQRASAFAGREIREWPFYALSSMEPENLSAPWLTVPESDIAPTNKILICFTGRYKSAISPNALAPFKDKLVYVGLPREYDMFCSKYFKVDYQPVKSAKELLQIAEKSLGFIGNISGQYSFMEGAAIPRILCLPTGGGDVRPYTPNGKAVLDNKKLIKNVEALLS